MKATSLTVSDVILFKPKIYRDGRGFFFNSFNEAAFDAAVGIPVALVQDNRSRSVEGVSRGLHYQIQQPQRKLVRAIQGELFDVAVDEGRSSTTFGKWIVEILSADNKCQLSIHPVFGYGCAKLSDSAKFLYKSTYYWVPQFARSIVWNDEAVRIAWPTGIRSPALSGKDAQGISLTALEVFV